MNEINAINEMRMNEEKDERRKVRCTIGKMEDGDINPERTSASKPPGRSMI